MICLLAAVSALLSQPEVRTFDLAAKPDVVRDEPFDVK